MKLVRYLIFVVFNLIYKNGAHREDLDPYFGAIVVLMIYESTLFIASLFFIDKYLIVGLDNLIFNPVEDIIYGSGILICTIIYPTNHYYFIKKKKFDALYKELKHASINTRRNRIITYVCLALYIPIMIGIIGHLKYWF